MNNIEQLRLNLAQALITMDWLQAIASAREILELEPESLRERHLLAQLYLRVSGNRLATVQLQKVVQQAVRARKLWKAVAAQKCLDGCGRGDGSFGAYSHLFTMIVGPAAELAPGRARSFPPVLEQVMPETFELICREMELVGLIQNERWTPADQGTGLLIATWGRFWIERGEDNTELEEDCICAVEVGEGKPQFSALALETAEALHLPAEAFARFAVTIPGFEDLAGWKEQFVPGVDTHVPHEAPEPTPVSIESASSILMPPESRPLTSGSAAPVDVHPVLEPALPAAPMSGAPSPAVAEYVEGLVVSSETHLLWDMWKECRERRA